MAYANWQVDELARLVDWNGAGTEDVNWASVERSLGLPVPDDFKALVARFPRGTFRKYAGFSIPECRDGQWHFISGLEIVLEDLRAWREDEPGRFPYPLYPEKQGLVPWGGSTQGETFFWAPDAEDPSRWDIVVCESEEMLWERFHLTATGFIKAVVAGTLESTILAGPRVVDPLFTPFPEADTAPEPRYSEDAAIGLFPGTPSNELESIINTVGPRTRAKIPRIAWDDVEHRLGRRLPPDYKACIDYFGPGSFRDLNVAVPDCPIPAFDLYLLIDEIDRRRPSRSSEFAEQAGGASLFDRLMPWGRTDDGLIFSWEVRQGNPDEWSVYMTQPDLIAHSLMAADRRRLSMTGVIARYLQDPMSIVRSLVDSRTRTVVDPRLPAAPMGFSPAA